MRKELDFTGEVKDGIAWCRFNRPDSLNAWTDEMRDEMIRFLLRAETDPEVRCVVLQGAGRHFMAGGDVKSFTEEMSKDAESRRVVFEANCHKMHPAIFLLRRMPKPVLASVQGACAGLGVSFVLASDFAIASEEAFFTLAYIKLGTSPDGGASFFLPRTVGMKKAFEIALLGDRFDAAAAERYGIVNWVVPQADFAAETEARAKRLASLPLHAYARTKALLSAAPTRDLETHLQAEAISFAACSTTDEMQEGVAAFVEKRKADFTKF